MTVATFNQNNFTVDDAATYKGKLDANIAVLAGIAAQFAAHAAATPNMTVLIDAGLLFKDTILTAVSQQTTTTLVAPVSNPRIDRLVIDAATGVYSVIAGVEAASPVAPAITMGKLPIARLAMTVGMTVIANAIITDERTSLISSSVALQNAFTGLTLSTAGASTTLSIAAGQAANSTNTAMMTLAATMAKTTAAWAVGSTNGGLDTGAIAANIFYSWYLIRRPDTGVVDVIYSLSSTAPTLPANYTQFRRLGTWPTNASSQWASILQTGDLFQWLTPPTDVSSYNPGILAVTRTLSVPSVTDIIANLRVTSQNSGTSGTCLQLISDLAMVDIAPNGWQTDTSGLINLAGYAYTQVSRLSVRTNGLAQIRTRLSFSDASCFIGIATLSWTDARVK